MLSLTRRVGESIMVGDAVTFTILGVKGNQVRCGIDAPKEIAVHREEIYERIHREREEAAMRGAHDAHDGHDTEDAPAHGP